MLSELTLSISALVIELALFAFFFFQSRKKANPGHVRVFPYTAAMLVMTLLIFLTAAHVISLMTGTPVKPRVPKGMR